MLVMSNEKGTIRLKVFNLLMVPPPVPGDGTTPQRNSLDTSSHMENGFFKLGGEAYL